MDSITYPLTPAPLPLRGEREDRRLFLKIIPWILFCSLTTIACGDGTFVGPSLPLPNTQSPNIPGRPGGANPTQTPPPPVPSDPFADEVVNFFPGPFAGFGQEDFPAIVLGGPRGLGPLQGGTDVLSLGVGGSITLKSETPILDGTGPDFIVFENAFWAGGNPDSPFVELGEVSVSQNGSDFFKFPCEKDNAAGLFPGCAGVTPVWANVETNSIDPLDPEAAGGDPFDLQELGLQWVRYVRIRDLSQAGSGNNAGFDLDAVAFIYQ